jgi:hypothetical protein
MVYDDLNHFKDWWLSTRVINSPKEGALHYQKTSVGFVLFREGCYQVELFLMNPSATVIDHVHPNVDTFEVYLSGDTLFKLQGQPAHNERKIGDSIRVAETTFHSADIGSAGGAFLSIQKWLNGVKPTSVTLDWAGSDGSASSQESKSFVAPNIGGKYYG